MNQFEIYWQQLLIAGLVVALVVLVGGAGPFLNRADRTRKTGEAVNQFEIYWRQLLIAGLVVALVVLVAMQSKALTAESLATILAIITAVATQMPTATNNPKTTFSKPPPPNKDGEQ